MAATLDPQVQAAVDTLEQLLPKLPHKDVTFAKGLIASTRQYGPTAGRILWIGKLTEKAQEAAAPQAQPEQPTMQLGTFARVYGLFRKAAEKLQQPRIRLLFADRKPLVLARATDRSKYAGKIIVSDGIKWGGKFYGTVDTEGNFTKGANTYAEAEELQGILTKLAADPARVAAEYGRLTGRCCFCNLKLTDEQSTAAGYGPVCAKNYGLADERAEALPLLKTYEGAEA